MLGLSRDSFSAGWLLYILLHFNRSNRTRTLARTILYRSSTSFILIFSGTVHKESRVTKLQVKRSCGPQHGSPKITVDQNFFSLVSLRWIKIFFPLFFITSDQKLCGQNFFFSFFFSFTNFIMVAWKNETDTEIVHSCLINLTVKMLIQNLFTEFQPFFSNLFFDFQNRIRPNLSNFNLFSGCFGKFSTIFNFYSWIFYTSYSLFWLILCEKRTIR